jgi:hypothetical protein
MFVQIQKEYLIMPTVAKYDVVSEENEGTGLFVPFNQVTLDEGEAHDFPLETPGIRTDIRSLLSFGVVPLDDRSGVDFKMLIANSGGINEIVNGVEGHAGEMGAGVRVLQIVIRAGILQKTGNTLRIEVTEGEGRFSNIMLWYQTEV